MTSNADALIDRRRLRRKLSFWRIVTFVVLAGLVLALVSATGVGDLLSAKNRAQYCPGENQRRHHQ